MRIEDVQLLLNDKRVMEEIHRHLWIESQKAGYSIGFERARDEWIERYAMEWIKYYKPEQYERIKGRRKRKAVKAKK